MAKETSSKAVGTQARRGQPPPEIAALSTEELHRILLKSKKGLFGSPEAKLRADICARLRIGGHEAFTRGAMLAYSRFPDVRAKMAKPLADMAKRRAEITEKLAREIAKADKKRAEADAKLAKKRAKDQARLAAERVKIEARIAKEAVKEAARKAKAASKSAKAASKSAKAAQIPAAKAGQPKPGPQPLMLETVITRPRPESRQVPKDVRKDIAMMKPSFAPPPPPGPEAETRAEILDRIIDEQRRLEAHAAMAKEKRAGRPNPLKRVAAGVNRAISSFFRAIGHGIFVFFATLVAVPIDLARLAVRLIGSFLTAIYQRAGGLSPFGWKKRINQLVIYSGIGKTQEEVTGMTIVNGAVLGILTLSLLYFLLGWGLAVSAAAGVFIFLATWVVVYSVVNLMADKRTDEVEAALPDVLQIVSANISSGMTPYNALWVSARKEFGALAQEIKVAQRETLGGKPFQDALTDMSKRVRSNVLQRTIRLLIQGMKAGGELSTILQGIATDIRQMRLLQREMAANTMSYLMFILFGMLIGAPLLFSVSIQFVDVINKFQPESMDAVDMASFQSSPAMGGMQGFNMLSMGGGKCPKDFDGDGIPDSVEKEWGLNSKNSTDAGTINPETGETYSSEYQKTAEPVPGSCITANYLSTFAFLALFSIALFGSLLLGIIRDGKQSAGVKLMPVLIPAVLGVFFLMNWGLSVFFKGMFGV